MPGPGITTVTRSKEAVAGCHENTCGRALQAAELRKAPRAPGKRHPGKALAPARRPEWPAHSKEDGGNQDTNGERGSAKLMGPGRSSYGLSFY